MYNMDTTHCFIRKVSDLKKKKCEVEWLYSSNCKTQNIKTNDKSDWALNFWKTNIN